jgi:hypothetical protein
MMQLDKLSNYQLYALLQDKNLQKNIDISLKEEFAKRNITKDEMALLEIEWISKSIHTPTISKASLLFKFILIFAPVLLVLMVPFVWVLAIQVSLATYLVFKISKLKWSHYWLLICAGYVVWSAIVIALAYYKLN